jgi:hypothetical protein
MLFDDACGDAAAAAHRDALLFRPGPDGAAALATWPRARRLAGLSPGLARVLDEGCQLPAECPVGGNPDADPGGIGVRRDLICAPRLTIAGVLLAVQIGGHGPACGCALLA